MERRSDWRSDSVSGDFTTVTQAPNEVEGFDAVARLKALRGRPVPSKSEPGAPRILHISVYCYKSFPIRIFHVLSLKDGINSHALFFKNNFTNSHLPVTDQELDHFAELLREIDPHVVTLSIMAPYVVAARQMVEVIRESSSAIVVVGGKFPTISPDEALTFADYACKGDGELVLLRMHERLRNGDGFRGIQGLWYRGDDGEICDMGQDTLYQDMDDIPYPAIDEMQMHFIEKGERSSVDPEIFDPEILLMAERGCVYLCSYRVNALLIPMNRGNGRFVRIRSPENVLEEIDYRLGKYKNPERITFNDEIFGVFDDWVADFSAKYKAHCDLPFECELVPKLIREENVKLLADAGMNSLHFGVQSGHDEVRKNVMHRPGTNEELIEKSAILRSNGVTPQYDIILENPFDTVATLADALGLLLDFGTPINLNTYKMQYFPHYPFTRMALDAGHIREEDVSYESVAESVLYNMVYRPRFPATQRRDYLENCIYLVPWTWKPIRLMLRSLQKKHNPIFAALVTVLAYVRYRQSFEGVSSLIWLRRIYLGLSALLRGDIKTLTTKIRRIVQEDRHRQPNTGRLSAR